jgi:hypothetical protein
MDFPHQGCRAEVLGPCLGPFRVAHGGAERDVARCFGGAVCALAPPSASAPESQGGRRRESTLARLESARSLDSLILHMQEKVGPSPLARWPQDVRPGRPLDGSGGTGLLDSDLRRDALFGDSAGSSRELGALEL